MNIHRPTGQLTGSMMFQLSRLISDEDRIKVQNALHAKVLRRRVHMPQPFPRDFKPAVLSDNICCGKGAFQKV